MEAREKLPSHLTPIMSWCLATSPPSRASHLLQFKNCSDVWLDAPLLAILKSRGQGSGEDGKALLSVSAPVQPHG